LLLARLDRDEIEPPWRRVTGIVVAVPERWHALRALPLLSVEELVAGAAPLRAAGVGCAVWDVIDQRGVLGLGLSPEALGVNRIEEGWRDPPDGPVAQAPTRSRAENLFASYVRRELEAALERECAAVDLAFRSDSTATLLAATEVSWTARESRAVVVERARSMAREIARTYSGSTGVLVFDVSSSAPRTVVVRWTVEAAEAEPPRRSPRRRTRTR